MNALLALTLANIRSYTRDRAAVFWTLAFPLVFIVLFGLIFQGSGSARLTLGWVDEDKSAAAAQLQAGFAPCTGVTLRRDRRDRRAEPDAERQGRRHRSSSRRATERRSLPRQTSGGGAPVELQVYTDPSRPQLQGSIYQAVGTVLGVVNLGGRPPLVVPEPADGPDREPQRDQLLRAEHARAVDHAGRHLRGDPARRRPREAHPQAPRRDAAAALAAGRLERPDAGPHRLHPGGHHRRRRFAAVRGRGQSAA